MSRRQIVVCSLLSFGLSSALSSSLAHADAHEVALVPSCAEIDMTRDTLAPEAREVALRQLTRTLERADLLVVTTGCVDHYVVSHEQRDGALVVRVAGPHGIRRMRNGSLDRLGDMYERMVASLLEPPPVAEPVNTNDATDSTGDAAPDTEDDASADAEPIDRPSYASSGSSDDVIDAVPPDVTEITPDRLIYANVAVGSVGFGFAAGYRRASSEHVDFDLALTRQGGDDRGVLAFGVEALYVSQPRAMSTPYVGGGMSLASQHEGLMTGSGLRAEVTAGYAFARDGASRWFAQLDLGLPLYELEGSPTDVGSGVVRPTVSAAFGVGF